MSLPSVVGRMLSGVHAGESHLAWNQAALAGAPECIRLTSPDFAADGPLPGSAADPALGGLNRSPALAWSGVPPETAELVIIAQDPDAPLPRPVVHMIVAGILHDATSLAGGAAAEQPGRGEVHGGRRGYTGPKPPPGHGPHRYVFQIVAVDCSLIFAAPPNLAELLKRIEGHAIGRGRLIGTYEHGLPGEGRYGGSAQGCAPGLPSPDRSAL